MDVERTMEFLLQQNANVEAKLAEMLQADARRDAAIAALADRQSGLDDAMTSLAESMITMAENSERLSANVDRLSANVDRLTDHVQRSDERVDKLVSSIGEYLRRSDPRLQ